MEEQLFLLENEFLLKNFNKFCEENNLDPDLKLKIKYIFNETKFIGNNNIISSKILIKRVYYSKII